MADNITKKLIITGEIDERFKSTLKAFAAEISNAFKVDGGELKEAASALSKAAQELKAALGSIRNVNVGIAPQGAASQQAATSTRRGPAATSGAVRAFNESSQDENYRAQARSIQERNTAYKQSIAAADTANTQAWNEHDRQLAKDLADKHKAGEDKRKAYESWWSTSLKEQDKAKAQADTANTQAWSEHDKQLAKDVADNLKAEEDKKKAHASYWENERSKKEEEVSSWWSTALKQRDKDREGVARANEEAQNEQFAQTAARLAEEEANNRKALAEQKKQDQKEEARFQAELASHKERERAEYQRWWGKELDQLDKKEQATDELAKKQKAAIKEQGKMFSDMFRAIGISGRTADRLGNMAAGGDGGFGVKASKATKVAAIGTIGAMALQKGYQNFRDEQVAYHKRQQAFGRDTLSEGATSAMVGLSGRQSKTAGVVGALGGGAAGALMGATVGKYFGAKGLVAGSVIGGAIGAYKGWRGETEEEARRRKEETGLALEATSRARSHRASRLELQRGGMGQLDMEGMERRGANRGFTPEETLQQAYAAKQALGKSGVQSLAGMQDAQNIWGLGVGEQAQTAEAQLSLGEQTTSGALAQQEQMMKKAMAAGFDQSKAGKAMVSSVEYAARSAGMGTVDTGAIQEQLMRFVQGATGGTRQATEQDMAKALELQQRLKTESTSRSGISGIGNIMGTMEGMDILGPDASTEDFLNLMNMSKEAKLEHYEKSFGKEKGQKLYELNLKKDTMTKGSKTLGFESSDNAYVNLERGITTEQGQGVAAMQQGKLGEAPKVDDTIKSSTEFKSSVLDAKIQTEALSAGFVSLNGEVTRATTVMGKFITSLEESRTKLQEYVGEIERD